MSNERLDPFTFAKQFLAEANLEPTTWQEEVLNELSKARLDLVVYGRSCVRWENGKPKHVPMAEYLKMRAPR